MKSPNGSFHEVSPGASRSPVLTSKSPAKLSAAAVSTCPVFKNGVVDGDLQQLLTLGIFLQCGAPKIATVSWFITPITMVYGTYNYSKWGLQTNLQLGGPTLYEISRDYFMG